MYTRETPNQKKKKKARKSKSKKYESIHKQLPSGIDIKEKSLLSPPSSGDFQSYSHFVFSYHLPQC
jgi:hypothetical protein